MKPFKTIDEQIEILKSRGLKIDLDNTKEILFKEEESLKSIHISV